jgi:hypothetical protein
MNSDFDSILNRYKVIRTIERDKSSGLSFDALTQIRFIQEVALIC